MALAGFAGGAEASATVDLIWIDVSATDEMGKPICLRPANRDCPPDPRSPDGGATIRSVATSDDITLGVILTAGPNGILGAGVSVNYADVLPMLSVVSYRSLKTTLPKAYLPVAFGSTTDQPPYIDNIIAVAAPFANDGIGLPPGASAYLGTVTFRKDSLADGRFEISVGTDGPGRTDAVLDGMGCVIDATTEFNSAYLVDGEIPPTPTPTAQPAAPPGAVVAWGDNYRGQAAPPDAVNGMDGTAAEVAGGAYHGCAIQAGSRDVICWGSNASGLATPPDAVNGVSGTAEAIAAGDVHSCAIQAGTGHTYCWGGNSWGQSRPPSEVNGTLGTATDIAAGYYHSCAIRAGTGEVVCWGLDSHGQATPPEAVDGTYGTATDVAAGGRQSCAIQAGTGAVVCWGDTEAPPDSVNGTFGAATDIAAGEAHTCAIQAGTGEVVCWGRIFCGAPTAPDAVNGVSGTAVQIAASTSHICAIQAGTGNVVCWGYDSFGQATPPDTVNGVLGSATKIAASRFNSFAIVAASGPTPTPTATPIPTPTATPSATPTATPIPTPTATPSATPIPTPTAVPTAPPNWPFRSASLPSCRCEIQNVNPNQVVLKNVGAGGKRSNSTVKMVMNLGTVDASGAVCDAGESSWPTSVHLKLVDDTGDVLVDRSESVVCEGGGVTTTASWDVPFQGPLNCEHGLVPASKPGFSTGAIAITGSAPLTPYYVENIRIKCFE